MKRSRLALLSIVVTWLGLLVLCTAPVVAAAGPNLLTNGNFDTSTAGWTVLRDLSGTGTLTFATADIDGSPHSGSGLLTDPANGSGVTLAVASPCIAFQAGDPHVVSGWVWVDQASADDFVGLGCAFFSDDACTVFTSGDFKPPDLAKTGWQAVANDCTIGRSGSLMAMLLVAGGVVQHPPVAAYFDGVELRTATCVPSPFSLCLAGGRFEVTAHWYTPNGQQGDGHATPFSADSGSFWLKLPRFRGHPMIGGRGVHDAQEIPSAVLA